MTSTTQSTRESTAFTRTYRATGYCRLGVGPLASGNIGAGAAHLVVPVEQVVAVASRTRAAARTSVAVVGPDKLAGLAHDAVDALLADADRALEVHLTLHPPVGGIGVGLREAVAAAVIDSVARAEELTLGSAGRARLVAGLVPNPLGLAHGVPALVRPDGTLARAVGDVARLTLVIATPADPDPAAFEAHGDVNAEPGDLSDELELARWLTACSSDGDSVVAVALRELARAGAPSLGVVGGHTPTGPVAILLGGGPEHLGEAQHLGVATAAALQALALPARWRVHVVRTAAPSARV